MSPAMPGYVQHVPVPQSAHGQVVQVRPTVNVWQLPPPVGLQTSSRAHVVLHPPQFSGSVAMLANVTHDWLFGLQKSAG